MLLLQLEQHNDWIQNKEIELAKQDGLNDFDNAKIYRVDVRT